MTLLLNSPPNELAEHILNVLELELSDDDFFITPGET